MTWAGFIKCDFVQECSKLFNTWPVTDSGLLTFYRSESMLQFHSVLEISKVQ